MIKKKYLTCILVAGLLAVVPLLVSAQTAPVAGRVEVEKADGSKEPLAGALVEVFRTDIKSSLPSDKANKKGEFSFAGLPLGATFVLSVSGAGATPRIFPNVKAGSDRLVLTVREGDGKRWTEAEVREALAGSSAATGDSTRKPTEDEKEAEARRLKEIAEHEAKKKEVEGKNAVVQQSLSEGNAAFNAKNYDLAITKYDEGVAAQPDFAGSAPVLLNNKGASLKARAVDTFNKNAKGTDPAAKTEAYGKVKKDLADAADSYNRSWTILKAAKPGDIADPKVLESNKLGALKGATDAFR